MNVWTDVSKNRIKPNNFLVFIEIEKGSKNKYELDKETGLIILDRVLNSATHYPMNYGFIPLTLCSDGDPIDVFVLCSQTIQSGRLVQCYPIGVVNMTDQSEQDDKIIAIPFGDPLYNQFSDLSDLPKNLFDELSQFLSIYKQLENKKVVIGSIEGRKSAVEHVADSIKKFENEFVDKTKK